MSADRVRRYWKTKSGENILISKMTDSHLKNVVRLFANYKDQEDFLFQDMADSFNEDSAAYFDAQQKAGSANNESVWERFPEYISIAKELEKRGIQL